MSVASIAELVTSGATLLTAIGALQKGRVNGTKVDAVHADVVDVQAKVNGAAIEQVARVEQLADALTDAGVKVPARPSPAEVVQ